MKRALTALWAAAGLWLAAAGADTEGERPAESVVTPVPPAAEHAQGGEPGAPTAPKPLSYVPLPHKTITIRGLEDLKSLSSELEAAREGTEGTE